MKILIISQYFYPETFRVNDLACALKDRGHEVTVLTGLPNYPKGQVFEGYGWFSHRRDEYYGIPVLRVPMIPRGRGGALRLIVNYGSFILGATFFGLPRVMNGKFDACFVFATSPITSAIPANLFRLFTGCRLAIWIQDLWPEVVTSVKMIKSPTLVRWVGSLVRWIYNHSDRLLIQSESFTSSVRRWGAREGQIRYLPNWAESFYQPMRRSSSAADKFRILFAGNLGRAQGLEIALAAAEKVHRQGVNGGMEWHFMGDGSMKDWLEREVATRGLSSVVKILPRQNEKNMPSVFSDYSALLVSLTPDPVLSMVLPSKVQSAMACAMPLLVSADGETGRVVRQAECGVVSPAGDVDGLANGALALSRMRPEDLAKLGSAGRKYYEANFEREAIIGKIEDLLSDMARERESA